MYTLSITSGLPDRGALLAFRCVRQSEMVSVVTTTLSFTSLLSRVMFRGAR